MSIQIYHFPYKRYFLMKVFKSLSYLHWSMLLCSNGKISTNCRYDILVADPIATLETYGKETKIKENNIVYISRNDPLLLCKEMINRLLPKCLPNKSLPFQGGGLGILGYDLVYHFEKLPQKSNDLKSPDMAIGIYDWAIISDHKEKITVLVCHGDLKSRLNWLNNNKQNIIFSKCFHLTSPWSSNMNYITYSKCFRKIKSLILKGDCYQVNLAQRFTANYSGNLWEAFEKLVIYNNAPFSAWINLPTSKILSFSPEGFLRLESGIIQTRPIKGTISRLPNIKNDCQQINHLKFSEKDRAENLMIVDLLRNDIGRVAKPGSVKVPELFTVESFTTVHHLVSTITAQIKSNLDAIDLIRACFPGGSITGAPKIRAMEIIEDLEPNRRNIWCGSIIYLSICGNMNSSIVIRTLIAENGQLYCSAGGGITFNSQRKNEYQETLDKIKGIIYVLNKLTKHNK